MLLGGMAVVGLARSGVPGSFAVASSVKGVVEWSAGLFPDACGAKVQVVRLRERSRHED